MSNMDFASHQTSFLACTALISLGGFAGASEYEADNSIPANDVAKQKFVASSDCQSCHSHNDQFSHPVDIVPSFEIPKSLPLNDGRMTCLTCHEIDPKIDHAEVKISPNSLREFSNSQQFCAQCHSSESNSYLTLHTLNLPKAHLKNLNSLTNFGSKIDAQSADCLSCHDGLVTGNSISHTTIGSRIDRSINGRKPLAINSSHPIGVDYKNARRSSPSSALKHITELDSAIRLFDRQVGCNTCHSLYSQQKNKLVISNQDSNLCLSCHEF